MVIVNMTENRYETFKILYLWISEVMLKFKAKSQREKSPSIDETKEFLAYVTL